MTFGEMNKINEDFKPGNTPIVLEATMPKPPYQQCGWLLDVKIDFKLPNTTKNTKKHLSLGLRKQLNRNQISLADSSLGTHHSTKSLTTLQYCSGRS